MLTLATAQLRNLLSSNKQQALGHCHMQLCLSSRLRRQLIQSRQSSSSSAMHAVSAPPPTTDKLADDKKALRKLIKQHLKQLSSESMRQQSSSIAQQVLQSSYFQQARSVGLYVTCERLREVDTMEILRAAMQQGKQCFIPLVEDNKSNMSLLHIDTLHDLQPVPPFGILEPSRKHPDGSDRQEVMQAPYGLDLLLMPGLGFDREGRRLGRGGGYYDKLVHGLDDRARQQGWHRPWLVALAFQEQLVPEVPMGDHDRHVDVLATANELILCSQRARQYVPQPAQE